MTQSQQGGIGLPIKFGTATQPGPTGEWCTLHIETPMASHGVMFPPDMADKLADELPGLLRQSAREARKADRKNTVSKLEVIPANALKNLKGPNHGS